ncbi:DUF3006 domain-containing protein [Bacillus massilinigeriensis]|uniref:DUF3006 domain-containing protein n=1 Tax=Bacillus mediterraneensis TaxID=1805474 RepID=UPI0008F85F0F|nr:DUF3006 domain-containing protein [Bacillus mediterraneensis]
MKGIIDRIEGNMVVVETGGETKDFPKDIFPKSASAGDVVSIIGSEVKILKEETKKLRKEIEALMEDVWED